MQDVFRDYNKQKFLTNTGIIWLSLLLAVSINFLVLDGETGEALKANILETSNVNSQPDIIGTFTSDALTFSHTQPLQEVQEISFSLAYDPEVTRFDEPTMENPNAHVVIAENQPGLTTYIITLAEPENLPTPSTIISIPYSKENVKDTWYVNIINANFVDSSWETYLLSTQWVIF